MTEQHENPVGEVRQGVGGWVGGLILPGSLNLICHHIWSDTILRELIMRIQAGICQHFRLPVTDMKVWMSRALTVFPSFSCILCSNYWLTISYQDYNKGVYAFFL